MKTVVHLHDVHAKKSVATKEATRLKKRGAHPVVKRVWDEWAVGLKHVKKG